jgi:hypothetical protein
MGVVRRSWKLSKLRRKDLPSIATCPRPATVAAFVQGGGVAAERRLD